MGTGVDDYRQALEGFDAIIRAVPPDQWTNASPCEEWTARDVAGHVITNQRWAASMGGAAPAPERPKPPGDALGDDPVADWDTIRGVVEGVLDDDDALDRNVLTPFGEMPLGSFLDILVVDVVTHTWDLGRATGQDVALDPDLVRGCHDRVRRLGDAIRTPGVFGPALTVDAQASDQDRFLAYVGRDPA